VENSKNVDSFLLQFNLTYSLYGLDWLKSQSVQLFQIFSRHFYLRFQRHFFYGSTTKFKKNIVSLNSQYFCPELLRIFFTFFAEMVELVCANDTQTNFINFVDKITYSTAFHGHPARNVFSCKQHF